MLGMGFDPGEPAAAVSKLAGALAEGAKAQSG